MHTDKSPTHLITHFYRHIIVETYICTLTPTKTAPNISDYVDHTHSECVQEIVHAGTSTHTFTYANKVYHGTLDFRKAKCAWRTAMNYWLNLASVLVYGNIHCWQMLVWSRCMNKKIFDSQASLWSLHVYMSTPVSSNNPKTCELASRLMSAGMVRNTFKCHPRKALPYSPVSLF